jgi:hypothetical protein
MAAGLTTLTLGRYKLGMMREGAEVVGDVLTFPASRANARKLPSTGKCRMSDKHSVQTYLPQVAEDDTPQLADMAGECSLYDEYMIHSYIADSFPEERSALRLVLIDLNMDVVGEASDWLTTYDRAPASKLNMLLVEWNLLPKDSNAALAALRAACPSPVIIVLISNLDACKQAVLSCGADVFISKSDTPDRVAERLHFAAKSLWSE